MYAQTVAKYMHIRLSPYPEPSTFPAPPPPYAPFQLDNADFTWNLLKKKMYNRREKLASLQQMEAIEIRRKSDAFNERVEAFRKYFLAQAPFAAQVQIA